MQSAIDTQKKEPIVLQKPTFITMKELQPGTRVTMHLKVESVKITRERRRYEGTVNKTAECIVGDEHGCAMMIAKDNQLDIVQEGALITIRNAHANVVREHMRIEIDRWAKVEKTQMSSVSLVAMELKGLAAPGEALEIQIQSSSS